MTRTNSTTLPALAGLDLGMFRLGGLAARANRMAALGAQRRALARLDERLLDDVGLTRAQAEDEAARPFWDGPAHWRS